MSSVFLEFRDEKKPLNAGFPSFPVHIIRNDQEALSEATRLASLFRKGAIERDQQRRLPVAEIEQFAAAGLFGIAVPQRFGGPGVSAVTVGEVFRIIAAADPSIAQIPQNHFCWQGTLNLGTPEQEAFFQERILRGEAIGNANSEDTRKRPFDHETRAERVAGGYQVTGKKFYSTGAIFAQWVPIFGTDSENRRIMLYAERTAPGLEVINDWSGMGQRTTASGTTVLDQVFVPDSHVFPFYKVREKPHSFGPIASLIHSAIDLGIAEEALADGRDYILTKNRPWIENPHDEHSQEPFIIKRYGELTVGLNAARLIFRRASLAIDAFRQDPTLEKLTAARLVAADARILCAEVALEISNEIFTLTGARATLEKYDLDRHWRNVRTHSLHDPLRWKYYHVGNYHLNEAPLPSGSYI
jgi:SfnB family sulfur acquisition oxidoreductase